MLKGSGSSRGPLRQSKQLSHLKFLVGSQDLQTHFSKRPQVQSSLRDKENYHINLTPTHSPHLDNLLEQQSASHSQYLHSPPFMLRTNKTSLGQQLRSDNLPSCSNHSSKRAKYKIVDQQDGQQLLYCLKCAIRLGSQGFGVVSLRERKEESIDQTKREREMRQMINLIDTVRPNLQKERQSIDRQLQEITSTLQSCEQQHHSLFKELEKGLLRLREESWEQLQRMRSQRQTGQEHLGGLDTHLQQLKIIKQDLLPNIQRIKRSVEVHQYRSTMRNYLTKISLARDSLRSLRSALPCPVVSTLPEALEQLKLIVLGQKQQSSYMEAQAEDQRSQSLECKEKLGVCDKKQAFRSLFEQEERVSLQDVREARCLQH